MLFSTVILASFGLAVASPHRPDTSAHSARAAAVAKNETHAQDGVFHTTLRKHTREGVKGRHILNSDAVRLSRFRGEAPIRNEKRKLARAPVENSAVSYLASVGFGTPVHNYDLIVDTGSSNTWAKNFVKTADSKSTGHAVSVTYGSGKFSGVEFTDSITLTPGLKLKNQGVGRATSATGFTGVAGILGVGPEDLTSNTVAGTASVPTIMETAKAQGFIKQNILGVFFAPLTDAAGAENGVLTFGGVAQPRLTSAITFQNVLKTGPAAPFWGLSITSNIGAGTKQGIVDTGTTLIYIPSDWFSAYASSINGAQIDQRSGLLRFPKSSLNSVPTVAFNIGGKAFPMNKFAQLVEQSLYKDLGLSSNFLYSWIGSSGSPNEISFILGQKFLERYYSVYDTDNGRVGFASTVNSNPTSIP